MSWCDNLFYMLAKCGSMEGACRLFNKKMSMSGCESESGVFMGNSIDMNGGAWRLLGVASTCCPITIICPSFFIVDIHSICH
jgi:pentatricopeptide repeat protein